MFLEEIKTKCNIFVEKILMEKITYTTPGSITYLLFGRKPSEQSINIKFGYFGELLSKELIKTNDNFELLECGIQKINNKKKDVDLIFKDKINKIIYYRELKGNLELDTEKIIATIDKCNEIELSLIDTYPDYIINAGILNWSIYNRKRLSKNLLQISKCEKKGIIVDHFADFLDIIKFKWSEDEFYAYFSEIGEKIRN
jgi:hypothetical protein